MRGGRSSTERPRRSGRDAVGCSSRAVPFLAELRAATAHSLQFVGSKRRAPPALNVFERESELLRVGFLTSGLRRGQCCACTVLVIEHLYREALDALVVAVSDFAVPLEVAAPVQDGLLRREVDR